MITRLNLDLEVIYKTQANSEESLNLEFCIERGLL